jgi:hypothetical protein
MFSDLDDFLFAVWVDVGVVRHVCSQDRVVRVSAHTPLRGASVLPSPCGPANLVSSVVNSLHLASARCRESNNSYYESWI